MIICQNNSTNIETISHDGDIMTLSMSKQGFFSRIADNVAKGYEKTVTNATDAYKSACNAYKAYNSTRNSIQKYENTAASEMPAVSMEKTESQYSKYGNEKLTDRHRQMLYDAVVFPEMCDPETRGSYSAKEKIEFGKQMKKIVGEEFDPDKHKLSF